VVKLTGLVIESRGPRGAVGDNCLIHTRDGRQLPVEIIGFHGGMTRLMPLRAFHGVSAGDQVSQAIHSLNVPVGRGLLGRVVNGFMEPIDGKGGIFSRHQKPLRNSAPHPMQRQRIREPLHTGIRSIDGLLTVGKGQRLGIFAGSGVGKSVLLGMLARYARSDVNVIALIGERGREVREFIEKDLGEEGLRRSVVVVVTSDEPAPAKIRGAMAATSIAEHFRDQGGDVILMMDSITRFAMAQREIGLAVGEPPTAKGYTPSVFAQLPVLMERSGTSSKGSITGFYTVLVDGDDMMEPVADAVRSILDGHIVLSRKLAAANHFPAIDVLESVSRVMVDVVDEEHLEQSRRMRDRMAVYRESEDLIHIGAYARGSSERIDDAIRLQPEIRKFLRQKQDEHSPWQETAEWLSRNMAQ